jgi:predicted nucleic-acid-binding Zn-ribbon protein
MTVDRLFVCLAVIKDKYDFRHCQAARQGIMLESSAVNPCSRGSTMRHRNWQCPKCGHKDYEVGQFRATGGMFAKIFDVQNKRFSTITCENCTFTEVYRTPGSKLGDVFDFFVGS